MTGRPVTAQPPPMLGADYWLAAMERDDHTCHCTGACGRTHVKTGGKCDVNARRARLIAAPARPSLDPMRDAKAEGRAWCPTCHAGVMTDVRRQAKAVDPPREPLFEIEPGDSMARPKRGTGVAK